MTPDAIHHDNATATLLKALALEETALFLDLDGTLLDLCARPDEVVADGALRTLLEQCRDCAGGALAIVSGRALPEIDRILSPLILPAAAVHGAVIRLDDGIVRKMAPDLPAALRLDLARFAQQQGLFFEDKGSGLAIHYHDHPALAGAVLHHLQHVAARMHLVIQPGLDVVELKSPASTKATAIHFMAHTTPFAGQRNFFAGNDLTDETGFDYVNACGGVTVSVGTTTPTGAQFQVGTPRELRALLQAGCETAAGHARCHA